MKKWHLKNEEVVAGNMKNILDGFLFHLPFTHALEDVEIQVSGKGKIWQLLGQHSPLVLFKAKM